MVKRIKKRISKPEIDSEEVDTELVVEGGDAQNLVDDSKEDELPPPAFAIEPNISMSYQDGFTEVAERIFINFVDHWRYLAALAVIAAVIWGIGDQMNEMTHSGLAQERASISKTLEGYRKASATQQAFAKQNVRWFDENPDALTTPEVGNPPSKEAFKQSAEAFKNVKGELSHVGMLMLAQLGEASARFESAESVADYKTAGELFMSAASQQEAEPIARASAYQSAAAAFEQAQDWDQAVKAWEALAALDQVLVSADQLGDRVVFGLFAGVEQAKILVLAGKKAQAKALLGTLETKYAEALKNTQNKSISRELKILSLKAK